MWFITWLWCMRKTIQKERRNRWITQINDQVAQSDNKLKQWLVYGYFRSRFDMFPSDLLSFCFDFIIFCHSFPLICSHFVTVLSFLLHFLSFAIILFSLFAFSSSIFFSCFLHREQSCIRTPLSHPLLQMSTIVFSSTSSSFSTHFLLSFCISLSPRFIVRVSTRRESVCTTRCLILPHSFS